MAKSVTKTKLLVLGVHINSEGYPNVRYRIQGLKEIPWLEITEINMPMWKKNIPSKHHKLRFISGLFRAAYAHLSVIVKYLFHGRANLVYIPYPSIFIGFILALSPQFARPNRVILDAFISLYDTVVNDRKLLSSKNKLAILLKYIEKKAYSSADFVIVDTPQNVSHLCKEFDLSENRVVDIPLSTNEKYFQLRPQPYQPNKKVCTILFVGTFIPLHGVSTILAAATSLQNQPNIKFKIVGTGQTASAIRLIVEKGVANLEWIHAWQTPEALSDMIDKADICLGIFGSGEKTQRVCPLKLYTYAACGRAIITGDTEWTRHAEKNLGYTPFETVPVNNSTALADKIRQLSDSLEYRKKLAENSRLFYEDYLCNKIALSRLEILLFDG